MTIQRRRTGQDIEVYGRVLRTDRRGNEQYVADETTPVFTGRGWVIPDRSQRAEVMGQQEIIVMKLGIKDLPELNDDSVGLWTYVKWKGDIWDITQPPLYHHGVKRHTRHWSIALRKRPEARLHGPAVPVP